MDIPIKIGESLTYTDPGTGKETTVRVVSIEDVKPTIIVETPPDTPIEVDAPPDVRVIHEPQQPQHTIH